VIVWIFSCESCERIFLSDGKEFWRNTSIGEEPWLKISVSDWDFHLSRSVGLINRELKVGFLGHEKDGSVYRINWVRHDKSRETFRRVVT
jgi:hypothetical protein